MRIRKFDIYGFKSDKRVARIEFSEGKSSVVFGPNGVGKTTFLQIISAFLSKTESVLLANKVEKIECLFFDENSHKEQKVSAIREGGKGYIWKTDNVVEFNELKSISIGVERGIAAQNLAINPEIIFDFLYRYSDFSRRSTIEQKYSNKNYPRESRIRSRSFDSNFRDEMRELSFELAHFLRRHNRRGFSSQEVNFDIAHLILNSIKMENVESILSEQYREAKYKTTKNIQTALFDTIANLMDNNEIRSSPPQSPSSLRDSLRRYQNRIKIALSGGEENNFIKVVIHTLDQYCQVDVDKTPEIKPTFINLFQNMMRELEAEDKNLDGINIIVSSFNEQLEFGKKLVVDTARDAYIEVDGERHGLSELSSGERHILTFLTLMSTAGKGRNFVLIDEPEISLNLKWQRDILSILEGILPDSQIIVASHSPAISQKPSNLCQIVVERQ